MLKVHRVGANYRKSKSDPMATVPIGDENGNRNLDRKLQTLADSAMLLDPVTETEKTMAQAMDGAEDQKRTNAQELLNELKNLDLLQDKQINIFSCGNALLFFLEPEGDVKTTFEQLKLSIFRVQGYATDTIFLRVGTWVYPLFSELSPCYKNTEGIFIFPDIHSNKEGAIVGLLLPKPECDILDEILTELLGNQEDRSKRNTVGDAAVSVSENLTRGTSYLSRNLVRASENLAGFIDSTTSYALRNVQPQTMYINPNIEKAAHVAHNVSTNAASTTSYISSGLGHAVTALGKYISPYVSNFVKEKMPPNAVHFTANTYHGIVDIYNGLEKSGEILSRSLSNNVVKVVEHRYGQSVGHVTSDILSTLGNIYAARRNVNQLTSKSIAKATVRSTGQAILEDRREYLRQQHQQRSNPQ